MTALQKRVDALEQRTGSSRHELELRDAQRDAMRREWLIAQLGLIREDCCYTPMATCIKRALRKPQSVERRAMLKELAGHYEITDRR